MTQGLLPGDFVYHPDQPDWGLGQVQSVIGERVTANFENAGKVTVITAVVSLVIVEPAAPHR
jgi:transcription elongation factor GreA-like protein